MTSQDVQLDFQAILAKQANVLQCSNCEFFKLVDHKPTCEFTSLDFMDCLLVEQDIERNPY